MKGLSILAAFLGGAAVGAACGILLLCICRSIVLLEENSEEGKMHRGDSGACFVGVMVETCDTNDRIPVLFFICYRIR